MRAIIISNPVKNIKKLIDINKDDFIIAVDKAFDICLKEKVSPNLLIGDFDSIESNETEYSKYKRIKFSKEKDETDTYLALIEAEKLDPEEIIILGGIKGNRVEHFIANMFLFKINDNIKFIDENNYIFVLNIGNHCLFQDEYKYISFFAIEDSIIDLIGFKYPLNNYNLKLYDPLCVSNEIIDSGLIRIKKGKVLVIKSND